MKQHYFRLHRGDDLMLSLKNYAAEHKIGAAVIVSAVGCVQRAKLRDASGVNIREIPEEMEIVSLTGTLGMLRTHLHASFSKEDLSTIGGHLVPGCIINTTCEVVLLELDDVVFDAEDDPETGYDEIVFRSAHSECAH